MRVTYYQRLSSDAEAEGGARAAARAWAALRRTAARTIASLYAARQRRRRRWTARRLWCGVVPRVAAAAARARGYGYDSASYERNFDDGKWRDEEGVSWHARSFAASRLAAAV